MQWDVAAGDAVLRALGGGVKSMSGDLMRYGRRDEGWDNPSFMAYRTLPA